MGKQVGANSYLRTLKTAYKIYINRGIPRLILLEFRQPPALPYRRQYSTIGRPGLNHRVRDGNGCVPWAYRHRKFVVSIET